MKRKSISKHFNTLRKSVFGFGLAGFLLFGSVSIVAAQDSARPLPEPTVKYVGTLDEMPVFKLEFDNSNGDVEFLTIKDDEGAILYSERIREKQVSRKFKFDKADRDNVKLSFILSGNKESQSQVFKINTSTKVWNDVVVTRL